MRKRTTAVASPGADVGLLECGWCAHNVVPHEEEEAVVRIFFGWFRRMYSPPLAVGSWGALCWAMPANIFAETRTGASRLLYCHGSIGAASLMSGAICFGRDTRFR